MWRTKTVTAKCIALIMYIVLLTEIIKTVSMRINMVFAFKSDIRRHFKETGLSVEAYQEKHEEDWNNILREIRDNYVDRTQGYILWFKDKHIRKLVRRELRRLGK